MEKTEFIQQSFYALPFDGDSMQSQYIQGQVINRT